MYTTLSICSIHLRFVIDRSYLTELTNYVFATFIRARSTSNHGSARDSFISSSSSVNIEIIFETPDFPIRFAIDVSLDTTYG